MTDTKEDQKSVKLVPFTKQIDLETIVSSTAESKRI